MDIQVDLLVVDNHTSIELGARFPGQVRYGMVRSVPTGALGRPGIRESYMERARQEILEEVRKLRATRPQGKTMFRDWEDCKDD